MKAVERAGGRTGGGEKGVGTPLDQVDFAAVDPAFGSEAGKVFSLQLALESRATTGSPSPANIRGEIARWRELLAAHGNSR